MVHGTFVSDGFIKVRGARTNNLKNIDVDIPRNQLVVITGKSGSGKSSLAIDTIFAEGQRQFLESLSLYSRQFFKQGFGTDVDSIEGLPPTVCINQHRGTSNPRSTVGTMTEVYDYLRLLFAKAGQIECPDCSIPVNPQSIDSICERILGFEERTKVMILATMIQGKKGQHGEIFERVRKERLVRVRVDGTVYDIDNVPELQSNKQHTIDAVTDRIAIRAGIENRLRESVEMASKLSSGSVTASYCVSGSDQWQEEFYSTTQACPQCGFSCPELLPRTFSFNSPFGACEKCEGLGVYEAFELERLVPDLNRDLANAVMAWKHLNAKQVQKQIKPLRPILEQTGIDEKKPLNSYSKETLEQFFHSNDKKTPGLLTQLQRELATSLDDDWLGVLESFHGQVKCSACDATRLNRLARSVKIDEQSIGELCSLQLDDLIESLGEMQFSGVLKEIADPVRAEILSRLEYLVMVGLQYLKLNRPSDSLSGGELQRVRLAKSIGSGLTGTCFVLDEPSIGLHAQDNDRLIETLQQLKQAGNSVVVVEHDEAIMDVADHVVDVGPEAGAQGGAIVVAGSAQQVRACKNSLTGGYLAGRQRIERNIISEPADHVIELIGARGNNLKGVDVQFQLARLNCITGVSGSGKSTLVYRTLSPAIKQHFELVTVAPEPFESIRGLERVNRLVEVNQRPISRNPRGCAATYTGILNDVRKIFSATKVSRQLGFGPSRFSFNSKQGWCGECEGHGVKRISMKFMPDVFATCDSCNGARYNNQSLSVRFRDLNIAEVLALTVVEAQKYFSEFSEISKTLKTLADVGLGYLSLGQRSSTLSGGEAQRIKLATELVKSHQGHSLYLLDEPTTGLHFADVQLLLSVLDRLVRNGNTVIVIEHHLDVIRCADWVVDIGPEGGDAGGELVFAGSAIGIQACGSSYTGRCLRKLKA